MYWIAPCFDAGCDDALASQLPLGELVGEQGIGCQQVQEHGVAGVALSFDNLAT